MHKMAQSTGDRLNLFSQNRVFLTMVAGGTHAQILAFAGYLPEKEILTESFAKLGDLPASIEFKRLTGINAHREAAEDEGSQVLQPSSI